MIPSPILAAHPSVLVADDDTIFRSVLVRKLKEAGCTVETCTDGDEALGKLRSSWYDVVLLDYRMPNKTGLEVLAERKTTRSSSSPFIIVTSMEAEFQTDRAKELGADAIVFKSKLHSDRIAEEIFGELAK